MNIESLTNIAYGCKVDSFILYSHLLLFSTKNCFHFISKISRIGKRRILVGTGVEWKEEREEINVSECRTTILDHQNKCVEPNFIQNLGELRRENFQQWICVWIDLFSFLVFSPYTSRSLSQVPTQRTGASVVFGRTTTAHRLLFPLW